MGFPLFGGMIGHMIFQLFWAKFSKTLKNIYFRFFVLKQLFQAFYLEIEPLKSILRA